MTNSTFNDLPVDMICVILSYFAAHEILHTFSNISSCFSAILDTYLYYRLDFRAIDRFNFDNTCNRVKPDRVISLIISDANDTPNQSIVFFSRFKIEDFIHLRSIRLIDLRPDSWQQILPYIARLDRNHRLSIESSRSNDVPHTQLLQHAVRLKLNIGSRLISHELPYLRSLILSKCSMLELNEICSSTTQLQYLAVYHATWNHSNELILLGLKLKTLILHLEGKYLLLKL